MLRDIGVPGPLSKDACSRLGLGPCSTYCACLLRFESSSLFGFLNPKWGKRLDSRDQDPTGVRSGSNRVGLTSKKGKKSATCRPTKTLKTVHSKDGQGKRQGPAATTQPIDTCP